MTHPALNTSTALVSLPPCALSTSGACHPIEPDTTLSNDERDMLSCLPRPMSHSFARPWFVRRTLPLERATWTEKETNKRSTEIKKKIRKKRKIRGGQSELQLAHCSFQFAQ